MTLGESIRSDAFRHQSNCEKYLNLGMYNHACGSLRKSLKRHKLADMFDHAPVKYLHKYKCDTK